MENAAFFKLFAPLIFGVIGLAAFTYGKKTQQWKPMASGVGLMVYPYFVESTWLLYSIGTMLCVSLFVFRD